MNKMKGFTLIELLIVIAIIGILSAVVYPSYQDSIKKSRRADAQGALMGLAQAMERNYTTEGTYTDAATGGASTGAPLIFSNKSPIDGSTTYYNLTIVSADASSYIIAAEPVNGQAGNGVLILTSTGARGWDVNNTASGIATSIAIAADEWCWKESC